MIILLWQSTPDGRCPDCGQGLVFDYANYRTVTTLQAVTRLTLQIRRCPQPDCPRYQRPYRPEAEAHFARGVRADIVVAVAEASAH